MGLSEEMVIQAQSYAWGGPEPIATRSEGPPCLPEQARSTTTSELATPGATGVLNDCSRRLGVVAIEFEAFSRAESPREKIVPSTHTTRRLGGNHDRPPHVLALGSELSSHNIRAM